MDIERFIDNGDNVIVGVSGGADSMCLLTLLSMVKNKTFKVVAVHVNHQIRGSEADRDQKLVEKYCKKLKIECISKSVDATKFAKEQGMTLEEGARKLRYDIFAEVASELGANKIFVAHNRGDQAETILMHIARGASIAGAVGMSEVSGNIVRPLLNHSRDEILKFNEENKVPFITDSSNFSCDYARNQLRNVVLPELKKSYKNIEATLCSFGRLCERDEKFILSLIPEGLMQTRGNEVLLSQKIAALDEALSTRVIRRAVQSLGVMADCLGVHLKAINELFNKRNGSKLSLPHGLFAYKEYDCVVLTKEGIKTQNECKKFAKSVKFADFLIKVEKTLPPKAFCAGETYVDLDKIPVAACFRSRREGDIFQKVGAKGGKKLVDYLTDKKVPKRKRDELILLAQDNEVLAVIGLDVSEKVKLTKQTKNAAKITITKNC